MTTEVESIEALHLWLAEKLPALRLTKHSKLCPEYGRAVKHDHHPITFCRGWVPDVTTDALLEALPRALESQYSGFGIGWCERDDGVDLALNSDEVPVWVHGADFHEALCRAARKALEGA